MRSFSTALTPPIGNLGQSFLHRFTGLMVRLRSPQEARVTVARLNSGIRKLTGNFAALLPIEIHKEAGRFKQRAVRPQEHIELLFGHCALGIERLEERVDHHGEGGHHHRRCRKRMPFAHLQTPGGIDHDRIEHAAGAIGQISGFAPVVGQSKAPT